jgi:hypothetical protein
LDITAPNQDNKQSMTSGAGSTERGAAQPSRRHSAASDQWRDDRIRHPTDIGQDRTRTCRIREAQVFPKQIVAATGSRSYMVTRTAERRADFCDRVSFASIN